MWPRFSALLTATPGASYRRYWIEGCSFLAGRAILCLSPFRRPWRRAGCLACFQIRRLKNRSLCQDLFHRRFCAGNCREYSNSRTRWRSRESRRVFSKLREEPAENSQKLEVFRRVEAVLSLCLFHLRRRARLSARHSRPRRRHVRDGLFRLSRLPQRDHDRDGAGARARPRAALRDSHAADVHRQSRDLGVSPNELGGRALIELIVEETVTCYRGDRTHRHDWGYGCGECPACELRAAGYARYRETAS